MANGYKIYQTMKANITRKLRKHMMRNATKQMKRKMRSPDFGDEVVKEFFQLPSSYKTLDAAVLMDEFQWQRKGGSIYFPENTNLLELLWRSKMQIDPEYLEEFPESFVVCWPKGTVINGYELPPVLVNYASYYDRDDMFEAFKAKYLDPQTFRDAGLIQDLSEKNLHLTYCNQMYDGAKTESMYVRSSVPAKRVSKLLTSDRVLYEIGSYDGFGTMKLTDDEISQQWTLSRMVLHLLVYMQACPESIIKGWPDKVKERNFTTKQNPKAKPITIGSPIPKDTEGHSSPEAHWRNSHFRSYPLRKDGTRRKGVIFISGCLVNAEIDPNTVVKVVDGRRSA